MARWCCSLWNGGSANTHNDVLYGAVILLRLLHAAVVSVHVLPHVRHPLVWRQALLDAMHCCCLHSTRAQEGGCSTGQKDDIRPVSAVAFALPMPSTQIPAAYCRLFLVPAIAGGSVMHAYGCHWLEHSLFEG